MKEKEPPSRRSIIKAMGATGAGSFFGIGTAAGTSNSERVVDENDRKVVEWTGQSRDWMRASAEDQHEVTAIKNRMERDGWNVVFSESRSGSVESSTETDYDFGVIPFESEINNEMQAVIMWKQYETDEWDVRGYIFSNPDKETEEDGLLTVDDTTKMVKKDEFEDEGTIDSNPCTCLDPGGGDCVYFHDEYCDDFNLSCILWVIAAIGVSCGTAGPVGCLAGTGVAIGPYMTDDGCEICNEYAEDEAILC